MTAEASPDDLREALRRAGLDTVHGAFAYDGGHDLDKPGLGRRRRTRVELADPAGRPHVLYLKRYAHDTITGALRRWWRQGRPRSAAAAEVENIRRARQAGVPTMETVAWGEEPCPLGARRSYVIVTAVPGEALERLFEGFCRQHTGDGRVAEVTRQLAHLVRSLHDSGHVHRDLYASHVFLDDSTGRPQLYLIDLARMFPPRGRKVRWFVKDLAQLKYSMPPAWVAEFWAAFLGEYLPGVSREAAARLDRAIDRKVARMRRRQQRKAARGTGDRPA